MSAIEVNTRVMIKDTGKFGTVTFISACGRYGNIRIAKGKQDVIIPVKMDSIKKVNS